MRLAEARFCLDCETIHTDNKCPACGSKFWTLLLRWIKPLETHTHKKENNSTKVEGKGGDKENG